MKVENKKELKEIILSILFVSGEGLDKEFILQKLEISPKELDSVIDELTKEYNDEKGIHIIKYKNKVQLTSNPMYADYISEVLNPVREKSLTRAALETLAIIAYKQPITKLEIEDIRRVNCDYAVQILVDQNMIEVVGRKDAVGKPLLFATTENFLKRFNWSTFLVLALVLVLSYVVYIKFGIGYRYQTDNLSVLLFLTFMLLLMHVKYEQSKGAIVIYWVSVFLLLKTIAICFLLTFSNFEGSFAAMNPDAYVSMQRIFDPLGFK